MAKVKNWDQVKTLLSTLAKLEHTLSSEIEKYNKEEQERKDAFQNKISKIEEMIGNIRNNILEYAEVHKSEIGVGRRKTLKYPSGEISLRKLPARIGYDKGKEDIIKLLKKSSLMKKRFVIVTEKLNTAALKATFKAKDKATIAKLKKAGVVLLPIEEKISIKINDNYED